MKKILVGNPISLILGYSYSGDSSSYCLVQESEDLRPSGRDTTLALLLQKSISSFFNLDYQVISFKIFEDEYLRNSGVITEFRFVSHLRAKYSDVDLPIVEVISYGADVLLANSGAIDSLRGPRAFKIIKAWKNEIGKHSNISRFLIPEISVELTELLGVPVKQISRAVLQQNLRNFSSSPQFSEFIGIKHMESYSLIVVGPDYYGFDANHIDLLIASIRNIPNLDDFQILIKPHPASDLSTEMMDYFEYQLGRPTLNSSLKLDLDRVKTCPLEIFIAANDSNCYVGIFTSGVATFAKERVFWVASSDGFAEKMYRINYRKFLKYWSSN